MTNNAGNNRQVTAQSKQSTYVVSGQAQHFQFVGMRTSYCCCATGAGRSPDSQQVVFTEPAKNATNAQLRESGSFQCYGTYGEQESCDACTTAEMTVATGNCFRCRAEGSTWGR